MANNPLDTHLVDKAIHYAVDAHAGTERRSKGYPYVIHPMEAASIVASITNDPELIAAAALHDVVEDTDRTVEDLRREFGDRIARLVEYESDNTIIHVDKKAPWRERKKAALDRLAAAPYDVKIVAMGDKLSNMRAIAHDFQSIGDRLWQRFHAPNGKIDYGWRYRELAYALFDLADTFAYREFCVLIDQVFGPRDLTTAYTINLDDYEESGDGYTAVSYNHRGGHSMIKLFYDFMPREAAINELSLADAVSRMGITTPLPGRLITDGKRVGVEFQRIINKKSFSRAISQDPSCLEELAIRFARHCKQLHSTPCDGTIFPPASAFAHRAIDMCKIISDDEKTRFHAFVNAVPEAHTCIHGDMHIGNIITDGNIDYWIDLGDFSWGNPLFDFGMYYLTAKSDKPEEITDKIFHLSNAQVGRVWDIMLRHYLGTDDAATIANFEEQCRPFCAIRYMFYGTINKMDDYMAEFIRREVDKLK